MASTSQSKIVTIRASLAIVEEVRRIAERDAESQSTIVRRLLRVALDVERTHAEQEAERRASR